MDLSFFVVISIIYIAFGGVISAFWAKRITRMLSWLSSYLVIVMGLLQLGVVYNLMRLDIDMSSYLTLGLLVYNIGGLLVMRGRLLKDKSKYSLSLVAFGSGLIALSVVLILNNIVYSEVTMAVASLLILLVIILVGAFAGLSLSIRSSKSSMKNTNK